MKVQGQKENQCGRSAELTRERHVARGWKSGWVSQGVRSQAMVGILVPSGSRESLEVLKPGCGDPMINVACENFPLAGPRIL